MLVWRCYTILCGGVGDRMRGIRFMFLLAMSTNRLFFIDWPIRAASPYPLTAALLPAWVDWRVPVKALKHLERRSSNVNSVNIVSGENMRRRGRKKKKSGGHRRRASHRNETEIVSISPNGTDFINDSPWKEADVIYITNRMSRSALHDLCENPILQHTLVSSLKRSILPLVRLERILMHVLFAPTAVVSSLAAARSPPINQDGGYIAAHARTGVDLGEGKGPRLGYIASHLKEAAQRLYRCTRDIQQNSLSQQRVFLASDSHELKEHFIALARNEDVDVFTEERRPLHIDREGTMRNVNRDSGHNMCLAFLDVFADIFALAQADAFVYFHSGFAATAESFGKLHRPVPVHEIDLGSDEEGGDVPLQHEGECIPTEEDLYKDEKMRRPLD